MRDGCNLCLNNPEAFSDENQPFIKDGYFYYSDYGRGWRALKINFCPICGRPLTDEAVDMVMERLEELHDTSN